VRNDYQDRSLEGQDLSSVSNLRAGELRGSDLTGATLPTALAETFKSLPGVDEATKGARDLFLVVMAACLYCWLTMLSTTDVTLVAGNSTLALPIVSTPIPITTFFVVGPMLVLAVFCYMHLAFQQLWEIASALPAVFPDGRPLHERAYPWVSVTLIRSQFRLLKGNMPGLARVQIIAARLLIWWGAPFTLLGFWARYLVRHDLSVSFVQAVLVGISVWLSIFFGQIMKRTLTGVPVDTRPVLRRPYFLVRGSIAIAVAAFLSTATPLAFAGRVPRLGRANLKYAQFKAGGGMSWDFYERDLRFANAEFAKCAECRFWRANLAGASFAYSDLHGANFVGTDISGASFQGANLRGASLGFKRSPAPDTFRWADLDGAYAESTDLSAEELGLAHNWVLAFLADDVNRQFGLPNDHNYRLHRRDLRGLRLTGLWHPDLSGWDLRKADLSGQDLAEADLSGADLREAKLDNVSMHDAQLDKCDLRGVDLRNVRVLTRTQLKSAITEGALLPEWLQENAPVKAKPAGAPKRK